MIAPTRIPRMLSRAALALAVVFVVSPVASAFYWVGWPGGGTNQPPIYKPTEDPRVPPVPPPPPGLPEPPDGEEPPNGVPEPTTLALTGIGLAGLAGARWLRRRSRLRPTGGIA